MSPRPIRRRPIGPARRAAVRRQVRRTRRRIRRRTRRLIIGTSMLILVGGTALAIKLNRDEARRIEETTGKSIDDLTEEELIAAMRRLGIQNRQLTPADQNAIDSADRNDEEPHEEVHFCHDCGSKIDDKMKFCSSCGAKLE